MLKKGSIAVLSFVASGLAVSGSMGLVCTPGNVTVPCETKLWDLSAQALYLRSIYGSTKGYEMGPSSFFKEVKNNWNGGFRLEGSYHFRTGNDVTINWTHFSTSSNPTNFIGTLIIPGVIPDRLSIDVPFEMVNRNRLDQVNVTMGQYTNISVRDKMHFYAGLQYANIQSTVTDYYTTDLITALTDLTFSQFDNTDYKGLGPVLGIDYIYQITNSLSLTANGAGSILYGTNRYHSGIVTAPFGVIPAQVFFRKKGIVPGLEAKLGLNYAYAMAQGVANIQIGYQVVNYFNALEAQPLQLLANPIHSVGYGLFGPYFGLKYVGNV